MDIKPYWDRLIAGVKSAIVQIILFGIGWFIALAIASHWFARYSWYWFVTTLVIWVAYWVLIWLLQLAWARYRRSPN
jgi:uncharacterized membrane protein